MPPFPPPPPSGVVVVEGELVATPPSAQLAPPPSGVVIVEGGGHITPRAYEDGFSLPVRGLVEAQLGGSMMDPPTDGHTAALGLSLEIDALEWLAFGLHGHASWRNALAPDSDRDGLADRPSLPITALTLTAGPRFRVFTASESRDHLGLELGAGVLWIPEQTRPWGAVLDVALFGGIDLRDGRGSASSDGFILSPVVRYQQGLGDAGSYRAVLVGLAAGLDLGTAPRRGTAGPSGPHYTLGVDVGLGGGFLRQGTVHEGFVADVGLRMGLVIDEVFEPMVRFDFMHRVAGVDREGLDVYGMGAGFRVLFDPWAPLYLEALAGWAMRYGTPAPLVPGGLFVDVGAGLRWIDCSDSVVAVTLGVRSRVGVLDNDALTSIQGVFGVELDGGPRPDRPRCRPAPVVELAIEAPAPPTEFVPVAPPIVVTAPVPVAPEGTVVVTTPAQPQPSYAPTQTEIVTPAPPPVPEVPSGPSRIPLLIEPMLLVGAADSDRRIDGFVSGLSIALGVAPIDEVMLLLRFTDLGGSDEARDVLPPWSVDDEETAGLGAYLLGGDVRFRLFTDASERSGWTFELGGGWLALDGLPQPTRPAGWRHGGYLEAAIGHQRGVRFGDGGAVQFGAALRFQQGLGDTFDYRALLLTGSVSFEGDTPAAEQRSRHADFAYTLGARAHGGMTFYRFSEQSLRGMGGFDVHFGIPIGRWIEPRVQADLHFIPNAVDNSTSPLLAFLGGLRLRLDEVFPLYIDAAAGYAVHYDVAGQHSPGTSVLDVGIGARISDCSGGSDGALEFGVHLRMGLEQPRTDDALFLVMGYEYAGGTPMYERGERAHCRWSPPPDREVEERRARPLPAAPVTAPPPVVVPGPPPIFVPGPPPLVVPGPPPIFVPDAPAPPTIFVPGPPQPPTVIVPAPPSATVVVPAPQPPVVVQPRVEGRVVVQPAR